MYIDCIAASFRYQVQVIDMWSVRFKCDRCQLPINNCRWIDVRSKEDFIYVRPLLNTGKKLRDVCKYNWIKIIHFFEK